MPEGHAILANLKLCESCALTAKIHEMIDNKRWAEICKQIEAQGGTEPDRSTLRLMLGVPKGSEHSEKLKALRHAAN